MILLFKKIGIVLFMAYLGINSNRIYKYSMRINSSEFENNSDDNQVPRLNKTEIGIDFCKYFKEKITILDDDDTSFNIICRSKPDYINVEYSGDSIILIDGIPPFNTQIGELIEFEITDFKDTIITDIYIGIRIPNPVYSLSNEVAYINKKYHSNLFISNVQNREIAITEIPEWLNIKNEGDYFKLSGTPLSSDTLDNLIKYTFNNCPIKEYFITLDIKMYNEPEIFLIDEIAVINQEYSSKLYATFENVYATIIQVPNWIFANQEEGYFHLSGTPLLSDSSDNKILLKFDNTSLKDSIFSYNIQITNKLSIEKLRNLNEILFIKNKNYLELKNFNVKTYEIFDIAGKRIISGTNAHIICVPELNTGLYFIKFVNFNNENFCIKFFK